MITLILKQQYLIEFHSHAYRHNHKNRCIKHFLA